MIELSWSGFGTSIVAGRLISQKKSLALSLRGEPAETLRRVAKPGVTLSRDLLKQMAGNLSLSALPGLMLLALGMDYTIAYENLSGGGLRILFQRATEGPPSGTGGGAGGDRAQGEPD
jgi:hypothetical protein